MEKIDAREMKFAAREQLRRTAIRLLKKEPKNTEPKNTQASVARDLGVARGTVNTWWAAYEKWGNASFEERMRGNRARVLIYSVLPKPPDG
jgi:transposase-like protein